MTELPEIADSEMMAQPGEGNLTPLPDPESGSALDSIFGELTKKDEGTPAPEKPEVKPEPAPEKPEEKPAEKPEEKPAEKPAEKASDEYDKVKLPQHASPKSSEAFETVKRMARETQAKLQQQVEELQAKFDAAEKARVELEGKAGKMPDDAAKELDELRKYRLERDVEYDPEFRKIDETIKSNEEAVLKKLKEAGLSEKQLEDVKKIGVDKLDWEPILPQLTFQLRTYIQNKLVDNVGLVEKRAAALEAAKSNAQGFMQQRSEREVKELTESANQYLKQLPWTAEKQVPANATPEQKAAIEASNKLARESTGMLRNFLADRSPARFAELAVGTMIAHKQQAEIKDLEATTAKLQEQVKTLTAERDAAKKSLDGLKRAEVPRSGGITPPKGGKAGTDITLDGQSALDAHLAAIQASQS